MEKIKRGIAAAAMLAIFAVSANAASGDIAGKVYQTDIKTYFFDHEMNSYNIGGRTVVVAEELAMLGGIDVTWDAGARLLTVTDSYKYRHAPTENDKAYDRVTFPKDYYSAITPKYIYETDIKTRFCSDDVSLTLDSYNIGGRICIVVEELLKLGYEVVWDGEARELRVDHFNEPRLINTDIGEGYYDGRPEHGENYECRTGKLSISIGDESESIEAFSITPSIITVGPTMTRLTDIARITGLEYSFEDDILTLDTSNAKSFVWECLIENDESCEASRFVDISELERIYTAKIIADGKETQLSFEWWTMMGSAYHCRDIGAIVFGGEVYVPIDSISKLINARQAFESLKSEQGAEGSESGEGVAGIENVTRPDESAKPDLRT